MIRKSRAVRKIWGKGVDHEPSGAMGDFDRVAVLSLMPQRGSLIAAQGNALGSSIIPEKALKGRTNGQVHGLVAQGLKSPIPITCVPSARVD